jgi:hypothetical protein
MYICTYIRGCVVGGKEGVNREVINMVEFMGSFYYFLSLANVSLGLDLDSSPTPSSASPWSRSSVPWRDEKTKMEMKMIWIGIRNVFLPMCVHLRIWLLFLPSSHLSKLINIRPHAMPPPNSESTKIELVKEGLFLFPEHSSSSSSSSSLWRETLYFRLSPSPSKSKLPHPKCIRDELRIYEYVRRYDNDTSSL